MPEKDRLTGLFTDQYLRGDLDMEFQRARRFNRDLAFIVLEPFIDDPSRADMLYAVLKGVARSADAKVRDIDIAVRWGHQVLLVLPETGRQGAETVESKINESFRELQFTHPETSRDIPVSLRSAVVVFPHDGADKESILFNLRERLVEMSRAPESASPETAAEGQSSPAT